MKPICYTVALLILSVTFFVNNSCSNTWEVSLTNHSGNSITVKIYPVSLVFNNDYYPLRQDRLPSYNLYLVQVPPDNPRIDFINGRNAVRNYSAIANNDLIVLDFDNAGGYTNTNAAILGFGRYRFDIWYSILNPNTSNLPPDNYFTIEYDANYGLNNFVGDVAIELSSDIPPKLKYAWSNMPQFIEIPEHRIESWHQMQPNYWTNKAYGDCRYNTGYQIPNNFNVFPQDPRKDCNPGGLIPNQNHIFQRNDIGVLTLNLTLEKDVHTPTTAPATQDDPPTIVIEGDAVSQTGPTLTVGTYPNWSTLTFNPYDSPNQGLGTFLLIGQYGKLYIKGSVNPATGSSVIFQSHCNSEVSPHGHVELWPNATIMLHDDSHMLWDNLAEIGFWGSSSLHIFDNAVLTNCGAIISGSPSINVHPGGSYIIAHNCPNQNPYTSSMGNVDSTGQLVLFENSQLLVGESASLAFDGPNSGLVAGSGSVIQLLQGASITFTNGAYITANGCTFTGSGWGGLKFTNIGNNSSITNCTFTGAGKYIDISNDKFSASNGFTISGNTFNDGKVVIGNSTNFNIQNNTFNCYNLADNLLEITSTLSMLPQDHALNINGNNFLGGSAVQLRLDCYGGTVMPFYVTYNHFTAASGGSSMALLGYNIAGDFKYNSFENDNYTNDVLMMGCNMNYFANTIKSVRGTSLEIMQNSTAQLAPVVDENGNSYWYGGYNKVYLDNNDYNKTFSCAYFESGSSLFTNLGKNCFFIVDETSNTHISGLLPYPCDMIPTYWTTNNYWNLSPPRYRIYCGTNQAYVYYSPNSSNCTDYTELSPSSYVVTNKGGGIFDTVIVTGGMNGTGGSHSSVSQPPTGGEDKVLFADIMQKMSQRNYAVANTESKQLINTYDTSKYLLSTLDELYMAYEKSDTTSNFNVTNALFGELKAYLNQKMNDYQNMESFVDKSYDYYLMCLVKQHLYTEAIAGYENIMANHPDPMRRLTASWDRAAVVLLMNGGGGYSDQSESTISKYMNKDPHRIVKDLYTSKTNALNDNENSDRTNKTPSYSREDKMLLKERSVKFNPANEKEFKLKISSDLVLIMNIKSKEGTKKTESKDNNHPKLFRLYQNYPNPFNPSTTIKYDLPKDGFVNIKIYDALGKQVMSSDEFKKAGTYDYRFDASNLASGLYFYEVKSGQFSETKKMVLIK